MKGGWPGFLALVLFLILLLLFLAAASTPEVTTAPQLFNSTNAGPPSTPTALINLTGAPTTPLVVNPTLANVTAPATMPTLQPGSAVYVVQPGEWLADIARRHNTTVRAILAVNPQIIDPDAIQPGETLVLP